MPKSLTLNGMSFLQDKDGNEIPSAAEGIEHRTDLKWRERGVQLSSMKGKQYVELGVAAFDPARERPHDGQFIMFDRREDVNKLIRDLRMHRDLAFGKDA